jgi:hypothetical protein
MTSVRLLAVSSLQGAISLTAIPNPVHSQLNHGNMHNETSDTLKWTTKQEEHLHIDMSIGKEQELLMLIM